MAKTSNYAVTYEGLDVVLKDLNEAQRMFRMMGGMVSPNGLIRDRATAIAQTLVPEVRDAVRASPAPQAAKVAATVRAKRDRIPVVKVGATQPKLSGFRGRKPNKARHKGSVAWGVERGPGGGHRSYRGAGANFYGVARKEGGHGIGPRMDGIGRDAVAAYQKAIADVLRYAGVI